MTAKDDSSFLLISPLFLRLIVGMGVGAFMVSIPFWFSAIVLDAPHITAAVGFTLLCGICAAWLGERFVEALARLISAAGL